MTHFEAAGKIIEAVGGKQNVTNAWHCMTRLRFALKDEQVVDLDALNGIDPVVGSQFANGQLQVIIGTDVEEYYTSLMEELGLSKQAAIDEDLDGADSKKNLVTKFMDVVSGTFGPIVPAIAGAARQVSPRWVPSPTPRIPTWCSICSQAVCLRSCRSSWRSV